LKTPIKRLDREQAMSLSADDIPFTRLPGASLDDPLYGTIVLR